MKRLKTDIELKNFEYFLPEFWRERQRSSHNKTVKTQQNLTELQQFCYDTIPYVKYPFPAIYKLNFTTSQ